MKHKLTIGLVVIAILTTLLWAGSLNPPSSPTAGTMKPLNDVEPRIAIHQSDIPLTITASGSYYLAENVTAAGYGIIISANDVTIDLGGFTIGGSGAGATYGIYAYNRDNIEIHNGTIRAFYYGIYEESADGGYSRVSNIRAIANKQAGIYVTGKNHQIRNCTVTETGGSTSGDIYGIYSGSCSIVTGNSVYNNGASCVAGACVYGIFVMDGSSVTDNTVYHNGTSSAGDVCGIMCIESCTIRDNVVYSNGLLATSFSVTGISAGLGSVVSGNVIDGNGIYADSDYVYGLVVGNGSNVVGNSSYYNGYFTSGIVYGIFVVSGCTVNGNTSYYNGLSASGEVYGIYLYDYNLVTNNTSYDNDGINMNTPAGCVFETNLAP